MVQVINNWSRLASALKPSCQQGLKTVAKNMQGYIQDNAPRLTGFMADNVYVSAWDESDYGQGGEPTGSAYLLDEAKPDNDTTVNVGAAASYSCWVNWGHHVRGGGFVPANPFFDQGVEQAASTFESDMAQALAEGLV